MVDFRHENHLSEMQKEKQILATERRPDKMLKLRLQIDCPKTSSKNPFQGFAANRFGIYSRALH
jgi:hypothetical protein